MSRARLFIGGRFVDPHSPDRLDVIDPATNTSLGDVADADETDVDRAVAAARGAFDQEWSRVPAVERGRVLGRLGQALRDRAPELAQLETRNCGKPIVEAESDIDEAANCFEYYAGLATKIHGDVIPVPDDALVMALREPVGVAAQIIPWNFPLLMLAWKIAPALCAGCTVVLKPAEETPLSALAFAESFEGAGVRPGVVNIVTGRGPRAGAALVAHPDVDKVAFTGSVAVGRRVAAVAGESLKRVTLELGGKSPAVIFADADFEAAVRGALFGVFVNQGEVCAATSRILVERSIYPRVAEAMVERARGIRLGPGLDRATRMGPLVSQRHFDRVRGYQDVGKTEARLALGGGRARGGLLDAGFFVEPTIFLDVDPGARIAREEIFGPVATLTPFENESEAIRLANDST